MQSGNAPLKVLSLLKKGIASPSGLQPLLSSCECGSDLFCSSAAAGNDGGGSIPSTTQCRLIRAARIDFDGQKSAHTVCALMDFASPQQTSSPPAVGTMEVGTMEVGTMEVGTMEASTSPAADRSTKRSRVESNFALVDSEMKMQSSERDQTDSRQQPASVAAAEVADRSSAAAAESDAAWKLAAVIAGSAHSVGQ